MGGTSAPLFKPKPHVRFLKMGWGEGGEEDEGETERALLFLHGEGEEELGGELV